MPVSGVCVATMNLLSSDTCPWNEAFPAMVTVPDEVMEPVSVVPGPVIPEILDTQSLRVVTPPLATVVVKWSQKGAGAVLPTASI